MQPVVVLVAGREEGVIGVWDVETGSALTSYKTNGCPPNGLSLLGKEYFIAAQLTKAAIHAWTWSKDQVLLRSFAPTPLTSLAGSPCGGFVAGGGAGGAINLWCASSGRLLRTWPGHYKSVTAVKWSADGTVLCTAGADGVVSAWLTAAMLDPADAGVAAPRPWRTWPSHTLGVTGLALMGDDSVLLSSGLDGTVQAVPLGEASRPLRRWTMPVAVHAVLADPGGVVAYAGAADGAIHRLPLVGEDGAGVMTQPALEGHSMPVVSLALAGPDAGTLISGSEDGSVRFWDLRTGQQTRVLENAAKGGPVSAVLALQRPAAMPVLGSRARASTGTKAVPPAQPLAVLSKFAGAPATGAQAWEEPLVALRSATSGAGRELDAGDDGSSWLRWATGQAGLEEDRALESSEPAPASASGAAGDGFTAARREAAGADAMETDALDRGEAATKALAEENAKLKAKLSQAATTIEKLVALNATLQKRGQR